MWERVFEEALPAIRRIAPPDSRVLEVGYGDGLLTSFMAAEMGWRITGLDVSAGAFRTATKNVQRFGLSDRVDLRRVDPEATRRHSGTYDAVFVKTVLYISRTRAEYAEWLQWISSVLRPGGALINFETGRGGRLLRAYRKIRRREYVDLYLYDRAIDRLYDEQFEIVEKRYFSGWSQFLTPLPPLYEMAWRVEERLAPRTPENCFVAYVLGRKRGAAMFPGAKTTSAGSGADEGLSPGAGALEGEDLSVATEWKGYDVVKRAFDILAASAGLLVLSPVFLLIGLSIWAGSTGGVFYRGTRVGRFGIQFWIWKFRTMTVEAAAAGPTSTSEDDPRITRVGHILRRYKLDELPQLLNVLTGQMSLVGPRPQFPWAVAKYSPEERRVLTVRPGITDWASLRFHNEGELLKGQGDPDEAYLRLIHPEKMRLAIEYVDKRSLRVDAAILFRTIKRVISP